jgi:hypothetical protein
VRFKKIGGLDISRLPIPVDEHGFVRPMVIGGGGNWQVAWGFDGMTRPTVFHKADNSSQAILISRAINARINEELEREMQEAEEEVSDD